MTPAALQKQIASLKDKIKKLEEKRDLALNELRSKCQHLRLAEWGSYPPKRLCLDCGAQEEGWGTGWQALILSGDTWYKRGMPIRAVVKGVDSLEEFLALRVGSGYLVGQSADLR